MHKENGGIKMRIDQPANTLKLKNFFKFKSRQQL